MAVDDRRHPGQHRRAVPAGRFLRPAPELGLPNALVVVAGWSWRLLLIAAAAYVLARIVGMLALVVVSIVAAVLLTALLQPVARVLQRRIPGPLAALLTLLLTAAVIGGIGYFVVLRAIGQFPQLVEQFIDTVHHLQPTIGGGTAGTFHFDHLESEATQWLQQHRSSVVGFVSAGANYLFRAVTGVVLAVFVAFFLLYDGDRIWHWLLTPFSPIATARLERAGAGSWAAITGYVHGTAVIATIHSVVIGTALFVLGTPLALPLAVLVFLGSFLPLIGAVLAGGLAVLVTFSTVGWIQALILLGVLLLENELEAHLMQPLIVGRYVRLHPLAIGLALAAGALLAGIVGAIIAVPAAAVAHRALPILLGRDEVSSAPSVGP